MEKKYSWFWPITLTMLLTIYLLSSWTTWWYAGSFSQRAMVQTYPLFFISVGFLWENQKKWILILLAVVFTLLNQFQTWQYNSNIIHQSRMTKKAYMDAFFRTKPYPNGKSPYLLYQRSSTAEEHMPDTNIQLSATYLQDFEGGYHINEPLEQSLKEEVHEAFVKEKAYSGMHSMKLDSNMQFTGSINIPYNFIDPIEYFWVSASAKIWIDSTNLNTPFSFVFLTEYKGKSYKYRTLNSEDLELTPNTWYTISKDYMSPEVRNTKDVVKVYLWNRGKGSFYVDEIKVEIYEPIRINWKD